MGARKASGARALELVLVVSVLLCDTLLAMIYPISQRHTPNVSMQMSSTGMPLDHRLIGHCSVVSLQQIGAVPVRSYWEEAVPWS